ncbi:MAG: potassium transporter TrkG [Longimicrobiales bacterium]|nr:potassium transporter TrkG [Longimicrobiales bacterium]
MIRAALRDARSALRRAHTHLHRLSPPQLLVISFAALIVVGMVGLATLPALYTDGRPLGWIDALFTATSAVCVTGLIVVDTATHFTPLGQGFLLVLIQLGGLGMITVASLVVVSLGQRLSLRAESVVSTGPSSVPDLDARHLVARVVGFTLALEAFGALLLLFAFAPHFPLHTAFWHALFQSVSAFCNAGFSTFTTSLEAWAGNSVVIWTVMALVVLGGMGFLTLAEVHRWYLTDDRACRPRISIHSRIALVTTVVLLAAGWGAFAVLEWRGVLEGMPFVSRLENSLFMSVTARTAGFNTVPYAEASDPANFLTMLLMSIGGSPGSTAGGIKTTTFFLIGLLAWSRMRGRTAVSVWSRTIPDETIQRAVGLFVVGFAVMTGGILLFTVLESQGGAGPPFLTLMFEAVSAFNTVGLSLGVTPELEPGSRVFTTVLMFIGRVGPLAFASAIAARARASAPRYHYAREDVSVG